MNSQKILKEAQKLKENGQTLLPLQFRDKNTSNKQNGDETLKHYVVVETKKKKEVIQISSSESDAQEKLNEVPASSKQTQVIEKSKKLKKKGSILSKCPLCRSMGKKPKMKRCTGCRSYFHIECIQNEKSIPKVYTCCRCQFQKEQQLRQQYQLREQQRKLLQQQRLMAQQLQKLIPKKTQKQKKKEEYSKRHNEFMARYPYYIQDDQKFKYPIQDKLLIIYRQIFDTTNELPRPKPKTHPFIPSHMIADFLQIENFFSTFKQELETVMGNFPKDIRKNFLYIAMNSEVIDEIYSSMIFCLLKIYLSDIFDKNKTDNVKMLNQNCFFTLLTNMHENQDLTEDVIVLSAPEIIRYLSTIPSMKKSFEDFVFPSKYNLENKVYILVSLIKGLSEIDTFHEFVAAKSQRMQNMTKQKGQLVNQLKIDEAQNLSNKQKIKQYANAELEFDEQLNKNEEMGLAVSTRQITREKDKNKKKMQKLSNQKDKSEKTILEIRSKISEISKSLPFVTSQVVFLGRDRNESHYFFFCNEPNRIYCRYRNFLLDDSEEFYVFDGKEAISELHKSLNVKGIHEKHLSDMIASFVKEEIIVEKAPETENYTAAEPYLEGIYDPVEKNNVIDLVIQLEETFSNYLIMKNLQWAAPAERDAFLLGIKVQQNIQQIKQMIISLQESFLFVEPISVEDSSNRRMTVLDSDEEDRAEKKESKKKSPVRLWGINSERIKKYWVEYLQQCIDYQGIWICATILKNYVDRYVKKKMEFLLEQQKKEEKLEKQKERHRLRKEKHQKESQKYERQRSREQRPRRGRPFKPVESSQSIAHPSRPNLRQRKKRKFQIDSDIEPQQDEYQCDQDEQEYEEQESDSQDKCEICGQYGEMICCDSCPKVFHLECLGLKQIPEGEWNCVKCLEKMATQRQTRSRATKMTKQPWI